MKKYVNLFVCQTRFQLFSILNIVKQYNFINYGIVFINTYDGQEKDIKTIWKNKEQTYIQINVGTGNRLVRLLKFLLQIAKQGRIKFSRIFVGSFNGYTSLLLLLLCNKKTQVFFFDEGYSSYSLKYYSDAPMSAIKDRHKILKIIRDNTLINSKTIYLFVPELHEERVNGNILKICISDDVVNFFRRDRYSSKYDNANYIFFDQYPLSKTEEDKRYEILGFLNDELGTKCLIKTHPRKDIVNSVHIEDVSIIDDDTNLWEAESKDIIKDNKILVTVYSTAVFMPSLLFELNYKIILLYKLVYSSDSTKYREIDDFVKRFRKIRSDIEIFLPENYHELKSLLVL